MAVTDKLGGSVHNFEYGEQLMPLSTLLPFALVAQRTEPELERRATEQLLPVHFLP